MSQNQTEGDVLSRTFVIFIKSQNEVNLAACNSFWVGLSTTERYRQPIEQLTVFFVAQSREEKLGW